MLSGDLSEAAAAADRLSSSWLPEFDSPGISLDMTSLSAHGDDIGSPTKPDDCASAKSRSSETPAAPPAEPPAELPAVPLQSQAIPPASPQPLAAPSPKKQKQSQSDADIPLSSAAQDPGADPAAGTNTTSNDAQVAEPTASAVDHYGLTFTFTTDPEIDAIATSPLFSVAAPSASSSSAVDQPQPEDVATQQQQPDTSGDRRIKGRRASIASMLMRRSVVSKPVDATSIASKSTASPRLNTHAVPSIDALEPLNADITPSTKDAFSAAVVAAAAAAVDSTDSVKLPLDEPASEETPTEAPEVAEDCDQSPPATSSVSGDGNGNSNSDGCDTDDGGGIDRAGAVSSNGSSIKQPETNISPEPQPAMAQDNDAHSNEKEIEPTCVRECVGIEPLANDGSEPAAGSRTMLSRRSSRIFFEGITRKVQHVRQTTSMVLKRSVGSRLSVVPMRSQDNIAVDCGSIACDQQGERDVSADTTADSPEAVAAVEETHTENVDADVPQATDDTEPEDAKASQIDSKPRRSSRAMLTRGFVTVKRGTNVAVRSSVARVKNMFTAKRPPVTA